MLFSALVIFSKSSEEAQKLVVINIEKNSASNSVTEKNFALICILMDGVTFSLKKDCILQRHRLGRRRKPPD